MARPLRALHRRVLVLRARDATATTAARSALVLAPHADDESLACGATIARKRAAGTRVRVVVFADGGDELRRAETRNACAILGVDAADLSFLGFPEGGLDGDPDALDAALRTLLTEPVDELFHPTAIDAHPDHRALAAAVIRVAPGTSRLAYPVWYWRRVAWVDADAPRWRNALRFVGRSGWALVTARTVKVSTGELADRKRRAIAAHASQVTGVGSRGGRLGRYTLELFSAPEELFFVERAKGQSSKSR
ncbi:MAG: PIG-L deacetylase family protein [Acidimicrobiia bacterium]